MANSAVRNNHPEKYFGVDTFIDLFSGEDNHHLFFDSPTDYKKPEKNKRTRKDAPYAALEAYAMKQDKPHLYGIFKNPDAFEQEDFDLNRVLDILDAHEADLLIETSSKEILSHMDDLQSFAKKHTMVVVFPIGLINRHLISMFDFADNAYASAQHVFPSLKKHNIRFGAVIKPVLPYINDRFEHYQKIINLCKKHGADFVYPTFRIRQNKYQRKAYMALIREHMPQLTNIYMDRFGERKTLASEYQRELKRDFVFAAHKAKLVYGMKEIIAGHKETTETSQMSLFD